MLTHLILKRTLRDIQLLPPFNPTPFQTNLVQFCQSEEKETKDPPEMDSSLPKVTEQEKRVDQDEDQVLLMCWTSCHMQI